jgi:hypothetical protein
MLGRECRVLGPRRPCPCISWGLAGVMATHEDKVTEWPSSPQKPVHGSFRHGPAHLRTCCDPSRSRRCSRTSPPRPVCRPPRRASPAGSRGRPRPRREGNLLGPLPERPHRRHLRNADGRDASLGFVGDSRADGERTLLSRTEPRRLLRWTRALDSSYCITMRCAARLGPLSEARPRRRNAGRPAVIMNAVISSPRCLQREHLERLRYVVALLRIPAVGHLRRLAVRPGRHGRHDRPHDGVQVGHLPYAAELIDVAEGEERWRPAERVVRSFGLRLPVPERHKDAMRRYVDENDMRAVVEYSIVTSVSAHRHPRTRRATFPDPPGRPSRRGRAALWGSPANSYGRGKTPAPSPGHTVAFSTSRSPSHLRCGCVARR